MAEHELIGWIDEEDLESAWFDTLWPDAPLDEQTVIRLLNAAYEQCAAYAPAIIDDVAVPERYRQAQITQARAAHRATVTTTGDQIGDQFTVTVYPMDRTVKALLRPRTGVPRVL